MSIYALEVEYITQGSENTIQFPFKSSTSTYKLPTENKELKQQYKNNEADDLQHIKATKSLDGNRNIVLSSATPQRSSSIIISRSTLKRNMNHKGFGKAVFFLYENMENLFQTRYSNIASSINSKSSTNNEEILLSHIISGSLGRGHNSKLDDSVLINFVHIRNISNTHPFGAPVCVAWNSEIDNWSESGCHLLKSNGTMSSCKCTHLGTFTLLLRNGSSNSPLMSEDVLSNSDHQPNHILIAEVITYIAVGLSIILIVIILFKVGKFLS